MMKKFLIQISYTVLPVWLLLVGLATYLWVTDDNSGDLMRLGLIDSAPEYSDSIRETLLPEVYYTGLDNDSLLRLDTCDVLVIGDSFSHGGGMGKQGDYVNYLAHDSGRRVVVFTPSDPTLSSPMQVAYDILNLGCIDSTHVKNLVIEEVERYLVDRHCGFVTTHTSIPRPVEAAEEDAAAPADAPGPLQRVKDFVFYHLFGANPIYTVRLSQPAFSSSEPDKLYFYNEDVQLGFGVTAEQQRKVVDCYDKVIALAREKRADLVLATDPDADRLGVFALEHHRQSLSGQDAQRGYRPVDGSRTGPFRVCQARPAPAGRAGRQGRVSVQRHPLVSVVVARHRRRSHRQTQVAGRWTLPRSSSIP